MTNKDAVAYNKGSNKHILSANKSTSHIYKITKNK